MADSEPPTPESAAVSRTELLTIDNNQDALESARKRIKPQGFFRRSVKALGSKSTQDSDSDSDSDDEQVPVSSVLKAAEANDADALIIDFQDPSELVGIDEPEDVYAWAVLYENQRGATIFSTPYYSRFSLLPRIDPYPYSLPNSYTKKPDHLPDVTPEQFPLPDGRWQWVSKAWMIDMGSVGNVQHDGFEYNSSFRLHGWHAFTQGKHGAFVRRRRWIRLMMRPGRSTLPST